MAHHTIGLALGSGSARGWAHIGALKALEAEGIYPDIICGSSIGALVGAAYVTETMDALEHGIRAFNWRSMLGYMDIQLNAGGVLQGDKLVKFFKGKIGEHTIGEQKIAYGAVATDLKSGQEIWLREGEILDVVRASVALPGLLAPVNYQGRWLLDGGLVNPVPVSLCRAMGADIVIAVNLNGDIIGKHFREKDMEASSLFGKEKEHEEVLVDKVANYLGGALKAKAGALFSLAGAKGTPPGVLDVMASSINIMQDRITRSRMAGDPPDIILAPRLGHIGLFEFDQSEEVIAAGWQETMKQMVDIKLLIK